jgi:CubicO group peptidase (beta-lactamase class C family)
VKHPSRLFPIANRLVITIIFAGLTACAPSLSEQPYCHPINAILTKQKDSALPPLIPDAQISQIDAIVNDTMAKWQIPGCGLAVTRDDEIALLKTYGYSRLSPKQVEFDLGTVSAIGSISKTYTALAMLKLRGMQKVNLLSPATDYLSPQYDVLWDGALVQDLLVHTSGIQGSGDFWDETRFHDLKTIQQHYPYDHSPSLQPALVVDGFMYEPTNVFGPAAGGGDGIPTYSNLNYVMAGAIIDDVTQTLASPELRGYENFVWHEIARGNAADEPASPAMCLGASFREASMPTLANGHEANFKRFNFSDTSDGWGWAGPAGGWWATTGDLARLMLTMQGTAVLPQVNIDDMREDFGPLSPEIGDDSIRVGLGLELSGPKEVSTWYGKSGHIAGYSAHFRIWPKQDNGDNYDWGVAFMCNRSKLGASISNQVRDVLKKNLQQQLDTQEPSSSSHEIGHDAVREALRPFVNEDGRIDSHAISAIVDLLRTSRQGRSILAHFANGDWDELAEAVPAFISEQQVVRRTTD